MAFRQKYTICQAYYIGVVTMLSSILLCTFRVCELYPGRTSLPSRSPNTHHPTNKPINIRRGESGGRGVGRAFMVARVLFPWLQSWRTRALPHPRATIKE